MDKIDKVKALVKEIQNLFFVKKYNLIILETKKAIKKYPNISIFYNMLGLALSSLGRFSEAEIILQKGYSVNSNDLAIINNLANIFKNTYKYKEAEELYKLSISKKNNYLNAHVNYGNLKRDLNKFEEAIELYKKALINNNKVPSIHYMLAMAYKSLGNFKEAEKFAKKTIEIDKKYTKADLLISRSKKYTSKDNHLIEMEEKIKNINLNLLEKIDLYFALSKAYEDIGKMDQCFEYLEKGNELKRTNVNFDLNFEKKTFRDIKTIFSKINFDKYKNQDTNQKRIIFILGLPRSGTTLIEQIVSGHSKVYGSGELPYLSSIINKKFISDKNLSVSKINEYLDDNSKISEITKKYYSYLDNYHINENYITDKAPLNFMWIGFIKILFPHAKIIHCKRDSKDNCVSLYKNVFEGGINFCYTQEEIAEYYNLYFDLMKFWKENLPDTFLDVDYEKIVADPKSEIKKILKFCDLNWEDNCLNFSKNKTPIKTASVGQARNSIYSTSIKSFSKYEFYLKELFSLLKKKSPN